MTVDAQALYNVISASETVSASFTLKIDLFVNDKLFDTKSQEITTQTKTAEFEFENIPVGSMVKATGTLITDTKEISVTSDTVKMKASGTELSLVISMKDTAKNPDEKDKEPGKTVTNSFEVTTPDNIRIKITITQSQTIYLNNGQVSLSAKKLNEDGTESDEAVSIAGAQLYFGGNTVPKSYYSYKDGVFKIGVSEDGTANKLIAPGTYQLYITAGQGTTSSNASGMFDLEVQNKEYYEYSLDGVGDSNLYDFQSQMEEDLGNLIAPALIVITGNPEKTSGADYAEGVISAISNGLRSNNRFLVDLDMSGTGQNLNTIGSNSSDSFDLGYDNYTLQSITFSPNVTSINAATFQDVRGLKVIRFAGTSDDLEIEEGTFKELSSLETFEITGESKHVHTAANGTMLLTAGTPELINGQEFIGRSKIFAVTPKFTNLDLSDEEMFPDAINPASSNYITEIASYAFYEEDYNKRQLVITNMGNIASADDIGDKAFYNMSIPNLTLKFLPNENAFNKSEILDLTIDFDVTSENVADFKSFIGTNYDSGLGKVVSVTFNKSAYLPDNDKIFGKHNYNLANLTFKGDTQIGESQFENFLINSLVCSGPTQIGRRGFYCKSGEVYNGIPSLNLSGVTSLGDEAIYAAESCIDNGVFTLPPSIESMTPNSFCLMVLNSGKYESRAFRNAITSFSIDEHNENYSVILDGKVVINKSNELFIIVKNGWTEVNLSGTGIETIPGATKNGYDLSTFANWTDLASVNLSGVRTIEDGAFEKCPGLTTLDVPSSLESISARAFVIEKRRDGYTETNDTKIETITCASNSKYKVDSQNFMLIEKDSKKLIFMSQLPSAKNGALDFSSYSNDINAIAPYACARHSELLSVNCTGIKNIENDAFIDCYNLPTTNINLGTEGTPSLETIGEDAFTWCKSVYEYNDPNKPELHIVFPSSLKLMEYSFGYREGNNDSSVTISEPSGHPTAFIIDALGNFSIDIKNTNQAGNGMTLNLPDTGTWYFIQVNQNYDQELLKDYVTKWVEGTEQFPGVKDSNTEPTGITITTVANTIRQNTEDSVDYLLGFNTYHGWVYYNPSN